MPNLINIQSPLTLIGPARSGTSLLADAFDRHPSVTFVGETINLIFEIWDTLDFTSAGLLPLVENDRWILPEERAGRVVRQTFLTCFPDERPYWFQKPIGLPRGFLDRYPDESQWPTAVDRYWRVMRDTFPHARYFTILRHPCDIVLSSVAKWGYDEATLWQSLAFLAQILVHPAAPIEYALSFQDLVQNGEAALRNLFAFFDVPFHEATLGALSKIHAPAPGRESIAAIDTSRHGDWSRLDPAKVRPAHLKILTHLFAKFGYSLQFPEQFTADRSVVSRIGQVADIQQVEPHEDTPTQAGTQHSEVELLEQIARLQQTIEQLHRNIESLHVDYSNKLERQAADIYNAAADERRWVKELVIGKNWLEEQWRRWIQIAEDRETLINSLQQQIAKMSGRGPGQ